MSREIGTVAFAAVVSLGTWIAVVSGAKGEDGQTLMHAGLSGPEDMWNYSGEVIATKVQGQFCEGTLCAHGLGKVFYEGGWTYTGSFRYGDIIGEGYGDTDDGSYYGFVRRSAYPGGPPALCGEPADPGEAVMSLPGFGEVFDITGQCSGAVCEVLQCLKDWTEKAKSGQVASQEEIQQSNRWRDGIRAEQDALFAGPTRTFYEVSVAGVELREFLASQDWKPQPGAEIKFLRAKNRGSDVDAIQLYLSGNFEVPYSINPDVTVSALLPLKLRSGNTDIAVSNPWVLLGLTIRITDTGYEISSSPVPR